MHRKQRKSDGSFSLEGKRFEIPSQYRTLEIVHIRYAQWDLSSVSLVDPHTDTLLSTIYPQDKSANASGMRRAFNSGDETSQHIKEPVSTGIAPLLQKLIADYAATGLPPAYIAREEKKDE